ncbi:alanine racemase [Candidatus Epulonipiscium fishelsonii]|uniref:Alanine racemase n=1 Tax=Candidatus Epulonipiscium fishelsonii TaxID=77094 RepID=A0ACC8XGF0_9FIRM|nr:alanine racemase [Epulopiscium sp. SCG-B05WGA-EpuloA1]ONI42612.1 alanine racemase [Epulopiscium sp. SCG-B11WGA-EpuloA1]ONI47234.1 alanine racemase [Epulopiscium sp. SCG-C06WGA-EpuloA1]
MRVIAEIDTQAIRHNYRQIRNIISNKVEIIGIVKADGYGHGAIEVAKILQEEGVNRLAVAISKEAEELRQAGINLPILVLGYTPKDEIERLVINNLTQTVFSYDIANYINAQAQKFNKKVNIHVKIDTGMGRIGFLPNSHSIEEIKKISQLPYLNLEGMFTHFSTADEEDTTYVKEQWSIFKGFLNELKNFGLEIPLLHASNSAAIIAHRYTHLDIIRPGLILYGHYPSEHLNNGLINLKPAMCLKTQVVHIKELHKGSFIGYGKNYKVEKPMNIATIPIGYADGYSRKLANKGYVLINGEYANIVGNICMDQFMVDVTNIKNVKLGDEVVIFGKQGNRNISVEEIATLTDTINYEIICMIGKRVPRQYI